MVTYKQHEHELQTNVSIKSVCVRVCRALYIVTHHAQHNTILFCSFFSSFCLGFQILLVMS